MNQQQAKQQQQYYTTENNGQQLLMRHGANNVNRVLHWQWRRVSPVRHSPPTPGRQGENKPVNRIGRAETSTLFHSNSRHTTNIDTLLQQQIQGHQQMQQQQSYTTMDTIEQQLMMRQDANNNNSDLSLNLLTFS
jgi:hypothetical protein